MAAYPVDVSEVSQLWSLCQSVYLDQVMYHIVLKTISNGRKLFCQRGKVLAMMCAADG